IVPPGAVLDGFLQTDVQSVVQKTGDLMPSAQETLAEMKKVFQKFDKLAPLMEETLKEYREVGKEARKLVPEVVKTNDELMVAARNWSKVGERMDVLIATNEEKITKSIARLEETLKRVSDVFGDENQKLIRDTLRNAKAGSDRFEGIAKSTEEMIRDI